MLPQGCVGKNYKNTERHKDKITPTWQGAQRAPKGAIGPQSSSTT